MKIDDRSAEYLAGLGGHPSGQSEPLDRARDALNDPSVWALLPEGLERGLLESIRTAPAPHVSTWSGWVPRIASFATVAIIAVALLALWPSGIRVDLVGTDLQPLASGVATLDQTGTGWEIELALSDLPPAGPGSYYEGWVWSDDGKGVSIGTFHLRESGTAITLWAGVDVNQYPSIWVSLQQEGAGNSVSDEVVLRGRFDGNGTDQG